MPNRSRWTIHPTATVDPEAKLYGTGTIDPGATVEGKAHLDGCHIGADALIVGPVYIDPGAVVLPRSVVGRHRRRGHSASDAVIGKNAVVEFGSSIPTDFEGRRFRGFTGEVPDEGIVGHSGIGAQRVLVSGRPLDIAWVPEKGVAWKVPSNSEWSEDRDMLYELAEDYQREEWGGHWPPGDPEALEDYEREMDDLARAWEWCKPDPHLERVHAELTEQGREMRKQAERPPITL